MGALISNIIAAVITIPLLGYFLVFIISKLVLKNHRKAVRVAIDLSTLLLVISVHHLIIVIWNHSYLWVLLLLMISVAVVFVIIHWKTKQEILFLPVLKGVWRMNFLLFLTAYLFLIAFGLIQRLSSL
ncbi:DUF3397 domain-containing protein [Bacillus sp. T3]|uniref:DUF3397 domain-containing protein n=1 Tax=Bacillus sp. T3 TaxID=467262 RepID=UPI002981587B|nr:DUF3397 domain-containing protein [Bacillus sp. T3]